MARSEKADPEDVQATLTSYQAMVRREVDLFGGSVERFVGDGVLAIFGATVAHEDDAERAVRAALTITNALHQLNTEGATFELVARLAVNTGEVVVTPGIDPREGDVVTGDVVNTAARMQGIAPVGEVVVGDTTHRLTKGFINYEPLDPVSVKGKSEPIVVWRATSARSRFGVDVDPASRTPFVGREAEKAALQNAYQRMMRKSSVELVTIVGEPGVGKSRLLAEFSSYVEGRDELVSWRQGRSLPYGEGVTFWALGEVVKAEAGILESDSPALAADKLRAAVSAVVEDPDEWDWFVTRISPLVGARIPETTASAQREELFAAWRRFIEAIAARRPLVVVFEDLHWADSAMLEFIDHVLDWSAGVQLLIVGTTRPELSERRPDWREGRRNSSTVSLAPLIDSEIAQLISSLLAEAVLPARVHAALIERAGGNPLYAEEFIRMLWDQGTLQRRERVFVIDPTADIPLPDSVHAVIAARLDTLVPEHKAIMQNAAVVGKVFWRGALSAMGEIDEAEVDRGLNQLVSKKLVTLARESSIESQDEYSFSHALVRDVSYSQLSRPERARKHSAIAEWIEGIAGDRVGDHAEVLAHHYEAALELTRASRAHVRIERLEATSARFLLLAGERTLELDVPRAHSYLERALRLLPVGHPERGPALTKKATAARFLNRLQEAREAFEEAIDECLAHQNIVGAGEAVASLAACLWELGEAKESADQTMKAIELLESENPGPSLAHAYSSAATEYALKGNFVDAQVWAKKALRVSENLEAENEVSRALSTLGVARCELGDLGGLDDLRKAVTLGHRWARETSVAYDSLGDALWCAKGPAAALDKLREGTELARRRGDLNGISWLRAEMIRVLFDSGDWDMLAREADELVASEEASGSGLTKSLVLPYRAHVLLLRNRISEAESLERELLPLAREIGDLQVLIPALTVSALIRSARGDEREAIEAAKEFARATEDCAGWRGRRLSEIVRALVAMKLVDLAEGLLIDETELAMARDRHSAITARAIVAETKGLFEESSALYLEAAGRWDEFGNVPEHGQALLGAGRSLLAIGEPFEASERLLEAHKIFSELEARRLSDTTSEYLRQVGNR